MPRREGPARRASRGSRLWHSSVRCVAPARTLNDICNHIVVSIWNSKQYRLLLQSMNSRLARPGYTARPSPRSPWAPSGSRPCVSWTTCVRPASGRQRPPRGARKGTDGVSALMGSLQMSCFLSGTCWVFPLTYFYRPKGARAYLYPQSVKINYFCSGPISVDPICPQPRRALGLCERLGAWRRAVSWLRGSGRRDALSCRSVLGAAWLGEAPWQRVLSLLELTQWRPHRWNRNP